MCDMVDQHGKVVQAQFEALTSIIHAYEDEEAKVCAAVPQCHTDALGQAAEAALIWPVVVSILGL